MERFITDESTGLRYESVGDCCLIAGESVCRICRRLRADNAFGILNNYSTKYYFLFDMFSHLC